MILLDTNVISALMRPTIDAPVSAWLAAQPPATLYTASLCEAEIRYGIARLPAGQRRDRLQGAFAAFLAQGFAGHILVFDSACAAASAEIRVQREQAGRPIAFADAMIAGTAAAHGARVATRNGGDFAGCGITLDNPWAPQ
jgi:hypothetical protein